MVVESKPSAKVSAPWPNPNSPEKEEEAEVVEGYDFFLPGATAAESVRIPRSTCCEHLGLKVNHKGNWTNQFEKLLAKITDKNRSLAYLLSRPQMPIEAKLTLWNAIVRPAIEYGNEVWTMNARQQERMQSKHHQALKGMVGCNRTTSDWAVRIPLAQTRLKTRNWAAKATWCVKVNALHEMDRRRRQRLNRAAQQRKRRWRSVRAG